MMIIQYMIQYIAFQVLPTVRIFLGWQEHVRVSIRGAAALSGAGGGAFFADISLARISWSLQACPTYRHATCFILWDLSSVWGAEMSCAIWPLCNCTPIGWTNYDFAYITNKHTANDANATATCGCMHTKRKSIEETNFSHIFRHADFQKLHQANQISLSTLANPQKSASNVFSDYVSKNFA